VSKPEIITTDEAVEALFKCFSMADGGVSYFRFKHLMEVVDREALTSQAAQEIHTLVHNFARLIGRLE
jgi:hypothetical protein